MSSLIGCCVVTQPCLALASFCVNAPGRRFFKTELPSDTAGLSYKQIRNIVFEYIELSYNSKCLHSALGYQTPKQTEQLLINSKNLQYEWFNYLFVF
jgi:hypothetical protein